MDDRDRGRAAYRRRAWLSAFDAFGRADHAGGLSADDLELMAASGYMLDRYDEAWQALDHAHRIRLRGGDPAGAARCAAWLGLGLLAVGEVARAAGWFGRAGRLLDGVDQDCVERGYLLIPAVLEELDAGRAEAALRVSTRVAEIGERFSEPDLVAFALVKRGRALLKLGRTRDGLALLDEAMVGLMAGELSSPVLTGLLYCSGIDGCHEVHELRRARAWTAALTSWCDAQPEMVNFSGLCLVHRAEIMQLGGAWPEALAEAGRARERLAARYPQAAGAARYRQGELLRLLGRLDLAEDAFREASRSRLVTAAGAGVAEAGPGTARHRSRRDPARPGRDDRPARAGPAAAGRGRDPARRGRCRAGAQDAARELTRHRRGVPRGRPRGRGRGRPGRGRPGRRRPAHGVDRAAPQLRGVAGRRRALRARPRPAADRSRLPDAGRRGLRRPGARRGADRADPARGGRRPGPPRRADRCVHRARRPECSGAAGVAPGRRRPARTGPSPPSWCSANGPSTGT